MGKKKYSTQEILALIEKADPTHLKKYIISKIYKDNDFGQDLGVFLDKSIDKKEKSSPSNLDAIVIKGIKDAIEASKDDIHCYITYGADSSINGHVVKALEKIRNNPTTKDRIRMQLEVLDILGREELEPSDDSYDTMIDSIIYDLEEFQHKGKYEDRKFIFEACLKFLADFDRHGYESEKVEEFVLENYKFEFPEETKKYLETRIEEISNGIFTGLDQYKVSEYVVTTLDIMHRQKLGEDQLLAYARKYWNLNDVRRWFSDPFK